MLNLLVLQQPARRFVGTDDDDFIEAGGLMFAIPGVRAFINGRGGDDIINPGIPSPYNFTELKIYGDGHDDIGNDHIAIGGGMIANGRGGNDVYTLHGGNYHAPARLVNFNTERDFLVMQGEADVFRFDATERENAAGNIVARVDLIGLEINNGNPITDGQMVELSRRASQVQGAEAEVDPTDGSVFRLVYDPERFDSAADAFEWRLDHGRYSDWIGGDAYDALVV